MGYTPGPILTQPVAMKRDYDLAILIILIILCWPAALVYYFTRPEVPVQPTISYQVVQPVMPQPGYGYSAPAAAAPASSPAPSGTAPACPKCGRPATFIAQYNRYYCYPCSQYV